MDEEPVTRLNSRRPRPRPGRWNARPAPLTGSARRRPATLPPRPLPAPPSMFILLFSSASCCRSSPLVLIAAVVAGSVILLTDRAASVKIKDWTGEFGREDLERVKQQIRDNTQ